MSSGAFVALGFGGLTVASIGWWDDRSDVSPLLRLSVHGFAAGTALMAGGAVPSLLFPVGELHWGPIGAVSLWLIIIWLLNLYNFMDGIDGIAGVEAVTVAGVGAVLLLWLGETGWSAFAAVVALSSIGFLAWNWPPARIFLGDSGSGFLGFTLAGMAILTDVETSISLWPWFILLGVFIVDASVTLIRRALRGERLHQAHSDHAYQHAARHYGSHLPVTVTVVLINLVWLAPWAVAATVWPSWGIVFLLAAWTPLVLLGVWFNAGEHR